MQPEDEDRVTMFQPELLRTARTAGRVAPVTGMVLIASVSSAIAHMIWHPLTEGALLWLLVGSWMLPGLVLGLWVFARSRKFRRKLLALPEEQRAVIRLRFAGKYRGRDEGFAQLLIGCVSEVTPTDAPESGRGTEPSASYPPVSAAGQTPELPGAATWKAGG